MISIQAVEKHYPNRESEPQAALLGVTCQINEGDFSVVCGPASSGKTTFLKVIAGTAEPTKGAVFFDGEDLYRGCPMSRTVSRRHRVGLVVQGFGLLPNVSCFENVVMATLWKNTSRADGEEAARRAFHRVGLELEHALLPAQLSAEEQKRVLIARAITNEPRVLLVDEPTSGLIGPSALGVTELLADLHRQGQTIVVTSKEFDEGVGTRFFELREHRLFEDREKIAQRAAG